MLTPSQTMHLGSHDHHFQHVPLLTLYLLSYFHSFKGDTSLQTLHLASHLHSLWVTPHPRPCTWGHIFHSSCCRGIRPYVELRGTQCCFNLWQETRDSSRVAMGISGFLSSGNRGVRTPLELRWRTCVSSRVAARESDLLLSCSRNSEFLSSCCWKLGVSLRVAKGD